MDQQSRDVLPSVEMPPAQQTGGNYVPDTGAYAENQLAKQVDTTPVGTNQAMPSQPVGMPMQTAQPPVGPQMPSTQLAGTPNPQIADDTDLIEKEWVEKAKSIVEQTKHDPYLQNKEMGVMKADYLKKRYNKDVKLSE